MILAILMTVAALAATVIFINSARLSQPSAQAVDGSKKFHGGRLWEIIEQGDRTEAGLIDTGASNSLFPQEWLLDIRGETVVRTVFGRKKLNVRTIQEFSVGDKLFSPKSALEWRGDYPILGSDIIFDADRILLSKNGLIYDPSEMENSKQECIGWVANYQGNHSESPINSIYLILNINGEYQKVLLDTGRSTVIEGTSAAVLSDERSGLRLDLVSNSAGDFIVVSFYNDIMALNIGDRSLKLSYRTYNWDQEGVPYIAGSGFLNFFSIFIDRKNYKVCLIPVYQ